MKTEKINLRGSYEFKQGDTLRGKIIKQDLDSNKVTVKLTNGMEIEAEIQGEVDLKEGILKFEVAELKDNKLFLKLVNHDSELVKGEALKGSSDEIMNFILKEGLNKEDYNMLKAMIKYNIALTRENITAVKSIIEFSDKMNNNPQEIQNFINAYLNSKDIAVDSKEALQISQKLYEFFEAFSQTSLDEVLLFLENDIEFTKENLDSFNKLFNSENTMEKAIDIINEKMGNAIAIEDDLLSEEKVTSKVDSNNTLKANDGGKAILATLVKEKTESSTMKESVTIDIMKNNVLTDNEAREIVKAMKHDSDYVMSKEALKGNLLKHTGKEIILNDFETKTLETIINKEVIKDKDINFIKSLFTNIEGKQISVAKELESNDIRGNIFNISRDLAKNVTEKAEGAKEVIRNIISNLKESNENSSQILNIMKNSINDLKLFNKINDQYYCLDVPVNFKENEYPCKLIIKDDRRDGKIIDSSNFKVAVSVKTVKLGTVDALLDVRNKNIDVQLKCDKKVMSFFEVSKDKLKEIVESSGFTAKIEVVERSEELKLLSCREFFNDNNIAAVDITV